ncbi:protein mono-ADP-ribosyltransferase PARP3-like [Babylonia areolata]|uniref:protein mono-ADP-ribosyltransferase PARP3-like n=1 Tax=Babylonia areolata TaxID=304850 RepID=UPI003FD55084
MPPKRKAAAAKGGPAAKKGKKAAQVAAAAEEEEAPETMKDKITALKAADKGKVKKHKADSRCTVAGASVYEDYDAMLNQTNIGHNNNKFYVIQVVTDTFGRYYAWNRWGRVGEPGQNAVKGPFGTPDGAVKDFVKKFKDKTKNNWEDRASFTPVKGKYTLLEMAGDDDDDDDVVDAGPAVKSNQKVAKCTLDSTTQSLLKLIFDQDMFKDAMKKFDIDVKKMPLGKLSKTQIAKGFEILEELEEALSKKSPKNKLQMLSSKFYTAVPHDFGRRIPPVIDNTEFLQQKYDMLAVLGDIELAQSMQKEKDKGMEDKEEVPHPLDVNYGLLKAKLGLVDPKSKEYKVLEKYFAETKPTSSWRKLTLNHIWTVDRDGETDRYKVHDKIKERKLLWHGTNVAVVAAILKTGLRIMPHSGGRVGKGIYFASENDKSAGYVGTAGKKGIMFLNEVAIGKQHVILRDNSSLTKAPAGFDSVLAKGGQEPDPTFDTSLKIDGREVVVPQAKPKDMGVSSSFYQSEYLIYKESQNRIRYLLLFDFN